MTILRLRGRFVYSKSQEPVRDPKVLERLRSVYVPPAYTNVEYYPSGKLVATGVDADGRVQYMYSKAHKDLRAAKKVQTVIRTGRVIRTLQRRIHRDIDAGYDASPKAFMAAVACAIMLECNFRGGSRTHQRRYGHFGITTLERKHVCVSGPDVVTFDFVGKKGVRNVSKTRNKRIVGAVRVLMKKCKGPLFTTKHCTLSLSDLNAYLKPLGITSKDLRTWNANDLFLTHFKKHGSVPKAVEFVATKLHNTPSVCKSSYILKPLQMIAKESTIQPDDTLQSLLASS